MERITVINDNMNSEFSPKCPEWKRLINKMLKDFDRVQYKGWAICKTFYHIVIIFSLSMARHTVYHNINQVSISVELQDFLKLKNSLYQLQTENKI